MINVATSPATAPKSPAAAPPAAQAKNTAPQDQMTFGGVDFNTPVPSKADIVKMGYAKFSDWTADKVVGPYSEMTADQIAIGYSQIKTEANQAAAASKLRPEEAKALFTTADLVSRWQTKRLDCSYDNAEGGTMFHHAMPRDGASLTDAVGQSIEQFHSNAGQPAPELQADKLAFANGVTGTISDSFACTAAQFKQDLADERELLAATIANTAKLPIGARQVIGQYIAAEAKGWSADLGN